MKWGRAEASFDQLDLGILLVVILLAEAITTIRFGFYLFLSGVEL